MDLGDVTAVFSVTDHSDHEQAAVWEDDTEHTREGDQFELVKYYNIDKIGSLHGDMRKKDPRHTKGYPLKGGRRYVLKWMFKKTNVRDEVTVNLKSLVLSGVPDGGAPECRKCPVGHRCRGGAGVAAPEPCPPGSAQPDEGQSSCVRCDRDTCDALTKNRVNRLTCAVDHPLGGRIDLRPIGGSVIGPVVDLEDLQDRDSLGISSHAA
eukprot:gene33640-52413_t